MAARRCDRARRARYRRGSRRDHSPLGAPAVVGDAVSTVLFATELRYDLRVVPPLVAVYVSAELIAEALQKGTTQAALLGAIGVAATLAVAWAATRYILARGEIPQAATQPAAVPGAE